MLFETLLEAVVTVIKISEPELSIAAVVQLV